MPRTLYLNRDKYGEVTEATFEPQPKKLLKDETFDEWTGVKREQPVRRFEIKRPISSYKNLVWAMCRVPCRKFLFDAAWRKALKYGAELSQAKLSELDNYMEEAKVDAEIIENVIGELVNDPASKFHIYG
jgi:hypothetical protein